MDSAIVIVLCVVLFENLIVPTYCTDEKDQGNDTNKKRVSTLLNYEDKVKLLKIYLETRTGEIGHRQRIKERWDELHGMGMPQSGKILYNLAERWIREGLAEELLTGVERQLIKYQPSRKRTIWTSQMNEDILKFYHESEKEGWKQSKKIKELWDRKYPQHPEITSHNIITRVRKLQEKNSEVKIPKKMPLTTEEGEDLLRCHYMGTMRIHNKNKVKPELFLKKHPRFSALSYEDLYSKLANFRKRNPDIRKRILREVSTMNKIQHSSSPGETSESRMKESEFSPTHQIHDSPRGPQEYFNSNHTWEPGEAFKSKQRESGSTATFLIHDSPRLSEYHLNTSQENVWIDHMIQEVSSPNFHTFLDTNFQNLHQSDVRNRSESESYRHHSDRGQRRSSRGKQPALEQHQTDLEQERTLKGKKPAYQ